MTTTARAPRAPTSDTTTAAPTDAAAGDASQSPAGERVRGAMRGQGFEAQAAMLKPGTDAPPGAGGWSDPYGSMIDRRIRHARTAAALQALREAVEANQRGDHTPLAALLGGHTPRFSRSDLARLLRHCDARGAELARQAPTSAAPVASPTEGAAQARAAGSGPGRSVQERRTPPPDKARPGDIEGILRIYTYESGLVNSNFRRVGGGAAIQVLRDAVAREAQRLAPPAGRLDVAVGATSRGKVEELRPGARLTTSEDEEASIGMVELRVDADGFIAMRVRAVPILGGRSATVLGGFAVHTEARAVVRSGGRPVGDASMPNEPERSLPQPG